jgi:hypothetical protein
MTASTDVDALPQAASTAGAGRARPSFVDEPLLGGLLTAGQVVLKARVAELVDRPDLAKHTTPVGVVQEPHHLPRQHARDRQPEAHQDQPLAPRRVEPGREFLANCLPDVAAAEVNTCLAA